MKVTYPLSLKVSLWLLLNLLLLGAVAVGIFVAQGGLGWSALVAGPTGDRAQAKVAIIASEVAAAPADKRVAVLERFNEAYGAHFLIARPDTLLTATPLEIPPAVQSRIDLVRQLGRGPFGFGPGRGRGGPADGPRGGPAEKDAKGSHREPGEEFGRGDGGRGEGPPPPERRFEPPERRDREFGRFVARVGSPVSYWLGLRVPFNTERGRPGPTMLIARLDSFWALLGFLELESWILAGAAVLGLSVLFWLPLVRSITRSVGQLTAATEQIAEGRFDTRIGSHRRDELGKLGDSVNRMAARLDAHMTGQKRFLGDVAHELCSPLARLQMATGILADQAPEKLKETVADVRDEVQQMSTLVNELLAFTKAGLRPRDVALSVVALEPLAASAIAREDAAERTKLAIAPDVRVTAEPDLLARALANLVRNAKRYSGETGAITVSAQRQGEHVLITVDDEGPGVPTAALDRLGEPFFRPEEARTRETGGVGLGLAIVRNSVAACGGQVKFSNRTPRGFRAAITLSAG